MGGSVLEVIDTSLHAVVGIGRQTAVALSVAGWNLVLTARRQDALEETSRRCSLPENCLIVAGDVTDETFVKELFIKAVARFGRFHSLFIGSRH